MHVESPSTMFGATMCYVALRLLGVARDEDCMALGRIFLHAHGGCTYTGSWAKFYLCLLGAMEWAGHQVIPPEAWLLPQWIPFHPARLWCHCRMVYLPMSYLYGTKYVYPDAETDATVLSLREELYAPGVPYAEISWAETKELVAEIDNYSPIHPLMTAAQRALSVWEACGGAALRFLRGRGLAFAVEYMHAEDLQTNFIDIGPVNKVLNMLSCYVEAGHKTSDDFERHLLRVTEQGRTQRCVPALPGQHGPSTGHCHVQPLGVARVLLPTWCEPEGAAWAPSAWAPSCALPCTPRATQAAQRRVSLAV